MKSENLIYLLAFLFGVTIVSIFRTESGGDSTTLNRYTLAGLSFHGIIYEEFFLQIVWMRLRTVMGIWLFSKLFPKKTVAIVFALCVSIMLGGVAAIAIMANGVWGLLFFIGALIPQVFFYGLAFLLWRNMQPQYSAGGNRKNAYVTIMLILLLVGIGCVSEAYINPVLIKNIIKF